MKALVAAAIAVVLVGACSEPEDPRSNIRPGKLEPTSGPYVSVAVDNHFHDVHADETVSFDSSRPFVVKNQGSNLHNVTVIETGFSEDVAPGKSVRMRLDPGRYHIVCRYHSDVDMRGEFTVL